MNSKLSKKLFGILAVLLSVIIAAMFSGCADKNIQLYPGTWSATDIDLGNGWTIENFSFTVDYVGGDYLAHADDELLNGYIFIDHEAYSLTFNIDGEEIIATSSTYYRKELFSSGGTWRDYKFNFAGKLMQGDGSNYFDSSIIVSNINGGRVGSAYVALEEKIN